MVSMEDKNPTKNIGIRMVMNMSSDVKYVSTMGTNNLIIRIKKTKMYKNSFLNN